MYDLVNLFLDSDCSSDQECKEAKTVNLFRQLNRIAQRIKKKHRYEGAGNVTVYK